MGLGVLVGVGVAVAVGYNRVGDGVAVRIGVGLGVDVAVRVGVGVDVGNARNVLVGVSSPPTSRTNRTTVITNSNTAAPPNIHGQGFGGFLGVR